MHSGLGSSAVSTVLLFHDFMTSSILWYFMISRTRWIDLKTNYTITLTIYRHSQACLTIMIVYWNLEDGFFSQWSPICINLTYHEISWKLLWELSQTLTVETAGLLWYNPIATQFWLVRTLLSCYCAGQAKLSRLGLGLDRALYLSGLFSSGTGVTCWRRWTVLWHFRWSIVFGGSGAVPVIEIIDPMAIIYIDKGFVSVCYTIYVLRSNTYTANKMG